MEFLTTIIETGSIGQFISIIAFSVIVIFGLFEYYKLIVYGSIISEKEQAAQAAHLKRHKSRGHRNGMGR